MFAQPLLLSLLAFASACLLSPSARAEFAATPFLYNAGINTAFATSPPNDPSRLLVVNRTGRIHLIDRTTNTPAPSLFLDISADVQLGGEGGLLGMAFHPDYASNGKFYVYFTTPNENENSPFSSLVREYTVSSDPNVAGTTYRDIITFEQPTNIHNAGWIGFNPAVNPGDPQHLYIASGDGGHGGNGQNLNTLLGKMLRIDIDGDDFPADDSRNYAIPSDNPFIATGRGEIFAYGLRNPWRNGFDSETGDLWIGDVGEARIEEVNLLEHGSGGGQDYGWARMEGSEPRYGSPKQGETLPTYEFFHRGRSDDPAFEGNAVTGGYVYRGPDADEYGKYFFADLTGVGNIWSFDPSDPYGTVVQRTDLMETLPSLVSFGEDSLGNLYGVSYTGPVHLLEPGSLRGDYNDDGRVDAADYVVWRNHQGDAWGALANDPSGEPIGDTQLAVWRKYYGLELSGSSSSAVPEPLGVAMAITAFALSVGRRR